MSECIKFDLPYKKNNMGIYCAVFSHTLTQETKKILKSVTRVLLEHTNYMYWSNLKKGTSFINFWSGNTSENICLPLQGNSVCQM